MFTPDCVERKREYREIYLTATGYLGPNLLNLYVIVIELLLQFGSMYSKANDCIIISEILITSYGPQQVDVRCRA